MYGPCDKGHWTRTEPRPEHGHLRAGLRYRVTRSFQDFDGDLHPVGERWTFLGANFLPQEDGLSLFVSLDGEHEWHLRMQWTPERQGLVLDSFESFVAPE